MEYKQLKIVYLLPGGLHNPAGMERVTTIKANYLTEKMGYDVSIVTTEQMGRPVFFPLSEKIHLYHLDVGIYSNYGKESFFERGFSRIFKLRRYKKKLTRLLNDIRPDITISTLGLDIEFIHKLKDGSIKLGELHFPSNFRQLMTSQLSKSVISNFMEKIRTRILWKKCGKLSRLIVLTEEEKTSWKNKQNVIIIPNPLPFLPEKTSSCQNKKVIAVGRLAYEKGFDLLIESWKSISKKYPDWGLHIFGEGIQKDTLHGLIKQYGLHSTVFIHDYVDDIHSKYLDSSLSVFPSRCLEAFPMVLIEAISCGIPLVAFDSPCGPKDIITDEKNGFLVKSGDLEMFSKKISELIESEELRQSMGKNARESSLNYKEDRIMGYWIQLFKELKADK